MARKIKLVLMIIMIAALCLSVRAAGAAEAQKEAPVKAAPAKKTAADIAAEKAAQAEAAKKAEMVKAAKDKLDNTGWEITLTESTEKPNKAVIKDTLRLTGGKIESAKLISEGFSPSNYTVRIKREDKVILETMQTGKEGELAFWRGEVKRNPDGTLGDVMNGVLSRHLNDKAKTVIDYTFVSEGKAGITPEAPKESPAVATPPAAEVTQSAVSEEAPAAVEKAPVKPAEKQPAETKKEAPKKKGWGR